ncbi:hypothetical protein C1I91_19385 [Clostridium manihotivorum]|uniref:Dinitrogenase iron-molybdenum cofactor biosynthesis domain-containing protein n=2 Tax=Clostridium manihotivorum TaxID=2320868 RepID=A0A3R5QY13_9CLOT|nr:hypothetical protein C1I91_19385 [Clostridium manihotivorum]
MDENNEALKAYDIPQAYDNNLAFKEDMKEAMKKDVKQYSREENSSSSFEYNEKLKEVSDVSKVIVMEDHKETPVSARYRFAIATKSGINVDQHFGHATEFHIYEYKDGDISFVELRNIEKYCTGIEECDDHEDKINRTIRTIEDCSAVLAMRAGDAPIKKLAEKGIEVFQMYDGIRSGINKAIESLKSNSKVAQI